MSIYLGIDTSNYTSSVAVYNKKTGKMISERLVLPVKENTCGLRQSDAVFLHVRQLGDVVKSVLSKISGTPKAIGVSVSPCDSEGSYMPCFLVGKLVGQALSGAYNTKLYGFSHQKGHIASALYSSNQLDLITKSFLALHISGGTTDMLKVSANNERIFSVELIGKSLDIKAGQAVDRVGVMLGLNFPCGRELEKLANCSSKSFKIKPSIKDINCSLSGVENKAKKMLEEKESKEDIAKFCLDFIECTIDKMCESAEKKYPNLPFVFAGGVMSNQKIKKTLQTKYNGYFAAPEFSSDNAAGLAILSQIAYERDLSLNIIWKG